jgi:MmyB-like transcription regulator ligand binding domain
VKRFHHPIVGDLELAFESFPLAADPSQSLLTYTAEPGSPSQDALNLLASWTATTHDIEQPASPDDSEQAESFETPD